ncbi:MAG: hypothetical protein ACXV3V_02035, partial [Actinomycetes bacterium]
MADWEHGLDRVAGPQLARVLDELQAREPNFHRLELGTTPADFEAQTAPDFWEVGASGQRYSREDVWATLEPRYANAGADPWETSHFNCRALRSRYLPVDLCASSRRPTDPSRDR